jgi:hypothetical protein
MLEPREVSGGEDVEEVSELREVAQPLAVLGVDEGPAA